LHILEILLIARESSWVNLYLYPGSERALDQS